ncbi:MAG TPA: glycosyltransferase [Bacteroidia bacterium]|nr:glycosyltransferase [Bacteroidia bacterium]
MKKTKNILVITYWSYKDALIQAYTLPYIQIFGNLLNHGRVVYLITLEQKSQRLNANERSQVKERLRLQGIKWMDFNYHKFGILGFLYWIPFFIRVFLLSISRNISHIHAWCTPAGAIGYLISLFSRKPLIVDSYEPHADVMLETNTWTEQSKQFRILSLFEKLQGQHAQTLICCTKDMADFVKKRFHFNIKHQLVKPACVNLNQFALPNRKNPYLLKKLNLEDKITCVYAGKFGGLYLEQDVFDFFKVAYDYWGDRFRILLLTNERKENLKRWAGKAGLPEHILLTEFVFHSRVADYMGLGDFGISPYNPVPSRKYSAPIKNAEYWALGLPVVITKNIADDSKIIEENKIGAVLKALNPESYLEAIQIIDDLLQKFTMEELYAKIRPVAEKQRNFSVAKSVYEKIY